PPRDWAQHRPGKPCSPRRTQCWVPRVDRRARAGACRPPRRAVAVLVAEIPGEPFRGRLPGPLEVWAVATRRTLLTGAVGLGRVSFRPTTRLTADRPSVAGSLTRPFTSAKPGDRLHSGVTTPLDPCGSRPRNR